MKLEVIQNGSRYKIISRSNKKHPMLIHLADILKDYNKFCPIKVGIYNIPTNDFTPFKSVYSYISKRTEKMNRKKYYKFLKGKRQMIVKDKWVAIDPNKISTLELDFLN